VVVLTRDPVADRVGSVVVAALTKTRRGLVSELVLTATEDGVHRVRCQLRQCSHDRSIVLSASRDGPVGAADVTGMPSLP
jgi:mRNA-degrading endonuclease toxin of MazEF toxin-antitoxin module